MMNIRWLPSIVVETSERLIRAINLTELAKGSTVWLAVTGLSRSGKTVFTISLIHNLLSSLHNPNRMPLLNVMGERRLIAAKLEGAKANRLPRFPYAANIETMACLAPDWPERTLDAQHRHDEIASEETAKQAHDLYRAYLLAARDKHGLSYLQPGRFLCPGNLGAVPYLWFAPLDIPEGVSGFGPNTLGALMEERFEVYKREAVTRFYEDHFRHYSRQIVLVDVLRALLAGRDAFEDTRLALDAILDSFRYGHGGILSQLLFGSHIDRVLFAATKADHVPDIQRDHLAALLRNMVAFPALDVTSSNARMDVIALASVISTAEDSQEIDGHRVQVVVGRPVGSNKQAKFFVGNVPIRPPRPDAWASPFLNVPVFEPPAIDPSPVEGIPHINLDLALEFLLGDRLR